MYGNYTPCSLHSELLKERNGHDAFVREEPVRVEESTTQNAHFGRLVNNGVER